MYLFSTLTVSWTRKVTKMEARSLMCKAEVGEVLSWSNVFSWTTMEARSLLSRVGVREALSWSNAVSWMTMEARSLCCKEEMGEEMVCGRGAIRSYQSKDRGSSYGSGSGEE
jgi:hypothetical protein